MRCTLYYFIIRNALSLIPSLNCCSEAFTWISNNFECGFYSIIISSLRYRFNYYLILFHLLLSEQESILAPLLLYGITTWYSNWIVIFLYIILFIEFLIIYFILYSIFYYMTLIFIFHLHLVYYYSYYYYINLLYIIRWINTRFSAKKNWTFKYRIIWYSFFYN